jgi:hypothetical protein
LTDEPWCYDPDVVKYWSWERMEALFFNPQVAAERYRRYGLPVPPALRSPRGSLTEVEAERLLFWKTGRRRGKTEAEIQAAWARHCASRAAETSDGAQADDQGRDRSAGRLRGQSGAGPA